MFKALDGLSGNETQSKPKVEHRLVKGDYGSDADIGVVSVDYSKQYDRKTHHWITLPDGQVRKYYNFEIIDEARANEMEAFGMAPRLKVSYRPVATELATYMEFSAFVTVCWLTVMILDGVVMLFTHQFMGPESFDYMFRSTMGTFIQDAMWAVFGILGSISLVAWIGTQRYYNDTRDDRIPHEWEREQLRKKRDEQDNGWI